MTDQPRESSAGSSQRLGRYELVEALGAGGMGQVYRARAYAAAGVTKDVCVKRIRSERLDEPTAIRRFIAEARLSMSLSHANIVPVFDFGRADDGYFLAMEWVDGADLRSVLKHGSLSPIVAAYIGAAIARALGFAHDEEGASTVHRDVKPANVLLARSGDVKLADFGVAAVVGSERGVAGTVKYMAPEQRTGAVPTPAADLFSLGKVIEEMSAGTDAPALEAIVTALLEPDASKRVSSADEVAERLESFVAAQQVAGAPSPRATLRARVRSAGPERRPVEDHLGAELSFVRDGHQATFSTRMGASGASQPVTPWPRGGAWLALGVVLALGTVALAGRNQPADSSPERNSVSRAQPEVPSSMETAPVTATAMSTATNTATADTATADTATADTATADTATADTATADTATADTATADTATSGTTPGAGLAGTAIPSTRRGTTRISADSELRVMSEVPTRAFGTLNVNAIPWANVFLDGRPIGETPLLDVRVSAGEHRVRLVNEPMGVDREMNVRIEAEQPERIVVRF